jgi:F420-dependent oxidoreductase-like protein
MDLCLMIEGQENVTWDDWLHLAMACEEHGFAALFRSDHYISPRHATDYGSLDAWVTLGGLARHTDRIRLGTLVSPVTFRHPSVLAKSVVTVDHQSGGRVELGMGAGWMREEHAAYGFPFPPDGERMDVLAEQVEIIHRLWDRDEEEVTFAGKHYRLEGVHSLPKPLQDPHPPLILGGAAGSRSAALAATWADEYNLNFSDPRACLRARARLTTAWEEAERDPASLRLSLMTTTLVGADAQEVERRGRQLMELRGQSGEVKAFLEDLGSDRLVGTPDQILDRLGEYAEAGVGRVMMQHLLHQDLEMVALIGQELIPAAGRL